MTTVLITGGHSGIGLACSRQLAARGIDIVLAGRSPASMTSVAEELRALHGIDVMTLKLDLSSLASVRRAAATLKTMIDSGRAERPAAVLGNAGGRFDGEITYSPDGYETTFATNCLGNFLLVELLVPMMADAGRVVFTASGTHDPDTMDGRLVGAAAAPHAVALAHDGKNGKKPLSAGKRYTTSKLCTIMYSYELARRLERAGSSIVSIAYDPGAVPGTGFLRGQPRVVQRLATSPLMTVASRLIGVTTSTVTFSGKSLADLAVAEAFSTSNGLYYQAREGRLSPRRSSKASYATQDWLTLWDDSRTLVQLDPDEEPHVLRQASTS